jgi:hypothetical protein
VSGTKGVDGAISCRLVHTAINVEGKTHVQRVSVNRDEVKTLQEDGIGRRSTASKGDARMDRKHRNVKVTFS